MQERYSTVCLDLLGLIAIGRYQPGDRLPTHDRLQEIYGVSRDTTVKAVRMLQDWGVVTTACLLYTSCGVSDLKMSDFGFEKSECMTLAKGARSMQGGLFDANPCEMTDEDCAGVFEKAYR